MSTKWIRRVTNGITIALIAGYVLFLVIVWKRIPETVAVHFNVRGEADSFGSKTSLLIEAGMMVLLFVLFAVIERFPSIWSFPVRVTPTNRQALITITTGMLGAVKILTVCLLIDAGLSSVFPGFPVWPLYLLLILMLNAIVIGIVLCVRARDL